jgi:hypothetical protein
MHAGGVRFKLSGMHAGGVHVIGVTPVLGCAPVLGCTRPRSTLKGTGGRVRADIYIGANWTESVRRGGEVSAMALAETLKGADTLIPLPPPGTSRGT